MAIARLTQIQKQLAQTKHVIPRPNSAMIANFSDAQKKLHGRGGDWTLLPNRNGYFHYGSFVGVSR